MSTQTTLYTVLLLLAGTAALGWALMAAVLRISVAASARLAAANALLVLAVLLLRERQDLGPWWAWQGPDALSLLAFALARDAMALLYKQRRAWRQDLLVLALLALAYTQLAPVATNTRSFVLVYSVGGVWFFSMLAWEVGRANARAFGRGAGLSLALPFGLTAVFMASRLLVAWSRPEQVEALPEPTLWAFVALLLWLNVSLVICVQARLLAVLRSRAERDGLTGLMNRRTFESRLRQEQLRAQRQPPGFALLLIDIDHFKRINDELGHAAGDAALLETARRLRAELRGIDALARLGGEEFVALLPATSLPAALAVAERLRQALAERPMSLAGTARSLSASLGVAHLDHGPAETLMERADAALYRAKHEGRNRVLSLDA